MVLKGWNSSISSSGQVFSARHSVNLNNLYWRIRFNWIYITISLGFLSLSLVMLCKSKISNSGQLLDAKQLVFWTTYTHEIALVSFVYQIGAKSCSFMSLPLAIDRIRREYSVLLISFITIFNKVRTTSRGNYNSSLSKYEIPVLVE